MRFRARLVLAVVPCLAFAVAPAGAGVDIDFGAAVTLGDRTDVFVSISSRYFDRDRASIVHASARYADPDDLAVALFLSSRSGRSPDAIHDLRRHGLSWWDIGVRYGVPVDAWFVPVSRDPGPPYGRAYGHWKKHRRRSTPFVLSDVEARNLVAVRMIHEYYGVPVDVAMRWRADGRPIRDVMYDEYGRRHGGERMSRGEDRDREDRGPGRGRGHGRGNNGKGHGRGHDR